MGMPGRFIFAAFALFIVWTLIHAWRSGVIQSGMWRYNSDDNPTMFALMFAGHTFVVGMFAAGAIGYSPDEYFGMMGLGWLVPFRPHPVH